MPVVSISVPSDLYRDLEERRRGRSRSGTWSDLLKVGTKMEGHRCPDPRKPKWPDSHECPQSMSQYFVATAKKFPKGWTQTVDGKSYGVSPSEA
jgi:hypothetical protein